jgi:hypothetical protein
VLATGTGGCACRVGARSGRSPALILIVVVLGIALRRGRSSRAASGTRRSGRANSPGRGA